jgi:hypothetical protein
MLMMVPFREARVNNVLKISILHENGPTLKQRAPVLTVPAGVPRVDYNEGANCCFRGGFVGLTTTDEVPDVRG